MTRRDIPNVISIFRILLVVPVIWLLLDREFSFALLLFFVAGVSDGLDGYLAKRNQWQSRLGSILDPLADKILLVSSFVTLYWLQLVPWWLLLAVLLRDLVIVAGAVMYHVRIGEYEMEPSWLSKVNTFVQILMVLTLVFSLGLYRLPDAVPTLMVYLVLVTTVASGINYVVVWGRRALNALRGV